MDFVKRNHLNNIEKETTALIARLVKYYEHAELTKEEVIAAVTAAATKY